MNLDVHYLNSDWIRFYAVLKYLIMESRARMFFYGNIDHRLEGTPDLYNLLIKHQASQLSKAKLIHKFELTIERHDNIYSCPGRTNFK